MCSTCPNPVGMRNGREVNSDQEMRFSRSERFFVFGSKSLFGRNLCLVGKYTPTAEPMQYTDQQPSASPDEPIWDESRVIQKAERERIKRTAKRDEDDLWRRHCQCTPRINRYGFFRSRNKGLRQQAL
jgi:hypothetical protein